MKLLTTLLLMALLSCGKYIPEEQNYPISNVVTDVGIGYSAIGSGSNTYNIAIGNNAVKSMVSGHTQVGIGYNTLLDRTTGSRSLAIGCTALDTSMLSTHTTGYINISYGSDSRMDTSRGTYSGPFGKIKK